MSAGDRDYEIIVFGATGFTGALTAEYLARNAPPDLRWAIAGRSRPKLDALHARLRALREPPAAISAGSPAAARPPHAGLIGVVQASLEDEASLARMAAQTRVLVTTVGPFIDYGEPVARACVEQGTDYIDSTGEPQFQRLLLARYAQQAERRGVRLVPSCGFDSIPADLGALFTVSRLPEGQPIRLSGYLRLKGVFSGGTERSAIKTFAQPPPGLGADEPPQVTAGRRVQIATSKVERRPELGGWVTPLDTIDASVVLRSAAALERYGPDFSYSHNVVHGPFAIMIAAALLFGGLALFGRFAPLRALLLRLVKKSGEGPSQAQMSRSWFQLHFVAECGGTILHTEVAGGDPGYGETSKMLAESALCLARDGGALPQRAGVLTPAVAMGELLIDRLQRAGLRFRVL